MPSVVLYIFLAVLQGHGGYTGAFGTEEECKDAQAILASAPDTLAISPCITVPLVQPGRKPV